MNKTGSESNLLGFVDYRQLHLVDVDNLTCGPTRDRSVHERVKRWYDIASNRQPTDLCFVAMSHYSAFPGSEVWEGAKLYWRSGPDGADHALIDALEDADLTGVVRVCLGSGDTIFRYGLYSVRQVAVPVAVVCPIPTLSTRLRSVADDLLVLPEPDFEPGDLGRTLKACRSKSWINKGPGSLLDTTGNRSRRTPRSSLASVL